jgi:hypothetical protein
MTFVLNYNEIVERLRNIKRMNYVKINVLPYEREAL